jgi:hypothetical protein
VRGMGALYGRLKWVGLILLRMLNLPTFLRASVGVEGNLSSFRTHPTDRIEAHANSREILGTGRKSPKTALEAPPADVMLALDSRR